MADPSAKLDLLPNLVTWGHCSLRLFQFLNSISTAGGNVSTDRVFGASCDTCSFLLQRGVTMRLGICDAWSLLKAHLNSHNSL